MVKYKEIVIAFLILFFLLFSFSPTIFELSQSRNLKDPNREFILEHNYYWPDYNLYLSKIRQGLEGRLTALERYTSEIHQGSLIQEFYVVWGLLGRVLHIDPPLTYLLARIILSPLLMLVVYLLIRFCFKTFLWQITAFFVTFVSASFPRLYTDSHGLWQIGRYMEWWSNIDALQRITFIPHILFGQVASLYLLYKLTMKQCNNETMKQLILFILLGNAVGLVFPPSLITLNGVIILTLIINTLKNKISPKPKTHYFYHTKTKPQIAIWKTVQMAISSNLLKNRYHDHEILNRLRLDVSEKFAINASSRKFLFIIFTLPSLLYLFLITKQLPWSSLVEFHRTHPMMIPFWEYILGTGPIFFLGLIGALFSIINRDKKFYPLIYFVLTTFGFAILFTYIKEQSPLRFTQTGLFIPLGILTAYFLQQVWKIIMRLDYQDMSIKHFFYFCYLLFVVCYLALNLYMMNVSFNWQRSFISQRLKANIPEVPYPPQTMYPLKSWMDGIRFLRNNTNHEDIVLAGITAGNYIPAYAGNTVYFGQSNTVNYDIKQQLVDKFFQGQMPAQEALDFLSQGRIKYIFFGPQEREKISQENLEAKYLFIKKIYNNLSVSIYSIKK